MTAAPTIERATTDEAQTIALGASVGRLLRPGDVVALRGDLGAGKTRFVRGVASGLGHSPDHVSSPTYVLMHEYIDPAHSAPPLIHIDAYRLDSAGDLESLGWDVAVEGSAIVVIEWAERIEEALPAHALHITIDHIGEQERRIRIEGPDPWPQRLRDIS
ncbi:MAG: tRNA (adenosine(37)-N6)-threonylcarbamoyltransferase complex ATPase subunit type 1 TsaE [Phycisphaeraceae bacterium]|nr:MAG: tRNA (adenosine(37)-N6)-threonylcarbamoyltransferase complex ATPase subunit type 1 TsaE [Phycisphaeraceae bacterium]